jgi:hypothetical protein
MDNNAQHAGGSRPSGTSGIRDGPRPNEQILKRDYNNGPPVLNTPIFNASRSERGRHPTTAYPPKRDGRDNFLSDWSQNSVLDTPMQLSSSMLASSLASMREGQASNLSPENGLRSAEWRADNASVIFGRRNPSTSDSHQASISGISSNTVIERSASNATSTKSPPSLQKLREALSPNGMSHGGHKTTKRRKMEELATPGIYAHRSSSTETSPSSLLNKQPLTTVVAETRGGMPTGPVNGVKCEPPSSPVDFRPRQIKEGTKFYNALQVPDNLRRTHYNYAEHRKEWLRIELDKMKKTGLIGTRVFFREDGVAIDW